MGSWQICFHYWLSYKAVSSACKNAWSAQRSRGGKTREANVGVLTAKWKKLSIGLNYCTHLRGFSPTDNSKHSWNWSAYFFRCKILAIEVISDCSGESVDCWTAQAARDGMCCRCSGQRTSRSSWSNSLLLSIPLRNTGVCPSVRVPSLHIARRWRPMFGMVPGVTTLTPLVNSKWLPWYIREWEKGRRTLVGHPVYPCCRVNGN